MGFDRVGANGPGVRSTTPGSDVGPFGRCQARMGPSVGARHEWCQGTNGAKARMVPRHEWCQGTNGARHVRGTYLVPKGLKENFTSLAAQSSAALLTHLSPDMTGQRSSDHSSSVPRSSSQGDAAGSQFRGWLAGIGRQRVAQ